MNSTRVDGWRSSAIDVLWLVVVGGATSWAIVAGARQVGATFDEPTYLERGLEVWRTGSYKGLMKLGTMPLAIDVQTLPIYLAERWRGEPFDVREDFARLLGWARLGNLVFWWLLLIYGLRTGRMLAGAWGGRLAVLLLAMEPTLLAHAGLATTDLAISATLLAFGYHFAIGRDRGWWMRVALPGVLLGVCLLAKASALAFSPLVMLAVEGARLMETWGARADGSTRGWDWVLACWRRFQPLRRDAVRIGVIGMTVAFSYVGSDWKAEVTFVKAAESLSPGPVRDVAESLARNACFFTNAGEGLVQQIKHNIRGHGVFLFDRTWRRNVWYYFPAVLSMKMTIPILMLIGLTLALRMRSHLHWPSLAALALFVFSFHARVQIGVRLVLPMVALAVVGSAIAFVRVSRAGRPIMRPVFVGLLAVVVLGSSATLGRVWPNVLCYTNEMWGDYRDAYRLASDSNFDWGQGLVELRDWAGRNRLDSLPVWYFGADPSIHKPPFHPEPIHAMGDLTPGDLNKNIGGDLLAVSTTVLFGSYLPTHPMVRYLRTIEPVDRTTTFLIYRLPTETAGRAGTPVR